MRRRREGMGAGDRGVVGQWDPIQSHIKGYHSSGKHSSYRMPRSHLPTGERILRILLPPPLPCIDSGSV
jgi:hypothetical protein